MLYCRWHNAAHRATSVTHTVYRYMLLTKPKVQIEGYWLSSFFNYMDRAEGE